MRGQLAVQVAEDPHTNMFVTTRDIKSGELGAFLLTERGILHPREAETALHREVTHRYSGVYPGTERQLMSSLLQAGQQTADNKAILKRSGVQQLKKGKGKTLKVAKIAGLTALGAAQGFQLVTMWNQFSADGVVCAGDWLKLTGEAVVGQLNPVGDAVGEFATGAAQAAEGSGVGEVILSGFLALLGL